MRTIILIFVPQLLTLAFPRDRTGVRLGLQRQRTAGTGKQRQPAHPVPPCGPAGIIHPTGTTVSTCCMIVQYFNCSICEKAAFAFVRHAVAAHQCCVQGEKYIERKNRKLKSKPHQVVIIKGFR